MVFVLRISDWGSVVCSSTLIVRPHQVGIYPVLQRYLRIGRAMALSGAVPFDPNGARVLCYPRYLYRTLPRDVLRALRYWASGDSFAAADQLIGVAMTCGRAQQWRRYTSRRPVLREQASRGKDPDSEPD